MSANLTPAPSGTTTALAPAGVSRPVPAVYRGQDGDGGADGGQQMARLLAALGRFKWLILALVLVGVGVGTLISRFVEPKYTVASTIIVTGATPGDGQRGPVEMGQPLERQGWLDLLGSFAIADSVVMRLALYLEPDRAADSLAFRNFQLNRNAQRFVPGEYTLAVTGNRYTLRDKVGFVNEAGVVGDSIGRQAGFLWRPAKAALGDDRTIKFTVKTPREASVEVIKRMRRGLEPGSNLIVMLLEGTVQQRPAETLNAWGEQFVRVSTDLKNARVTNYARILRTQMADAERRLRESERAFEQFRIGAITQPSETMQAEPIGTTNTGTAALAVRQDPLISRFFEQKYSLSTVQRDRQLLEQMSQQVRAGNIPVEGLLGVPTVVQDPVATTLRTSLQDLVARQAELRLLTRTQTDSGPAVAPRLAAVRQLTTQLIPQQLATVIAQLRQREGDLSRSVRESSSEVQAIPQRTTTQEALRRELLAATALYGQLSQRYAEAELAEKSSGSDVRVLDTAVMPLEPTTNTAPRILAISIAAALAFGLLLALVLDRLDRRFRYPMQATNDLGLQILGAVPQVQQERRPSAEKAAQILEAFRAIRMNVRYACMPDTKVALTITSPGANDGKSFVAANLALSFAEGGWRTVLIDGDLRRGSLHATFDLPQGPGLVEYLEGTSLLGEVCQSTSHGNLTVIGSGARHRRAPELLATPRMSQLVAALAADYDAIIVDTPPLGAGTDAYAIGTATRHMAIVLRSASTDMKLAKAKLAVLDQLPVEVIGAVLNEVNAETAGFQDYAYDPEYAVVESAEEPAGRLTAGR